MGVVIRPADKTKALQLSKVQDPSKVVSMNTVVKQTSLVRGFLWREFLNWPMQPTLLPKVLVASSSTLVTKDVGGGRDSFPFGFFRLS
jgi:hypothetical protein